ncbi:MAG: type II secretion system protein [Rickettsiales bacterium]|jgi:prepilin-type N-terminal cleavage/methylation domain-containing protein|nr:type II secretion system protein [Rickettsiales bacterium]
MLADLQIRTINRKAFTIIELTLVIGIISILLSAVLYARNLLVNNKLLIISSEYQQLKTAYFDFNMLYDAVPGDMNNAYDFFGTACGTDDVIANGGCNGDGDDSIESEDESFKSTQHMALASLVNGEYSGDVNTGSSDDKFIKSHFDFGYFSPILDSSTETSEYRGRFDRFHYIVFGKINSAGMPYDPLLSPQQALKIDNKLDDGVMWNGIVQIRFYNAESCNGSALVLVGNYNIDDTSILCNVLFYIDVN